MFPIRDFRAVAVLTAALGVVSACETGPKPSVSTPSGKTGPSAQSELTALPGWKTGRQDRALAAFLVGCPRLSARWRTVCAVAKRVPRGDAVAARRFFETWFEWRTVGDGRLLLTGYYEPVLRGSRIRSKRYNVPLYRRPADLVRGRPYATRAEISRPPLRDRLRVLLWLDDPVDAYTLHIQGSGLITLAEGGAVRVGVAATNERRYVSIGRILIRDGSLPRDGASMQAIRAWLKANPDRMQSVLNRNPRYVFFRIVRGRGPRGSLGVPLSGGRSLAVDPRHVPLGAPVWLDSNWPGRDRRPLRRLVIAQDTGGAIKGPRRGDLFVGSGNDALRVAGQMRQRSRYHVLVPRTRPLAQSAPPEPE